MIVASTPSMEIDTEWGARDMTCLTIALAVHALLLLWKGGMFTMPNAVTPENVLVSVNFMSEAPSYEPPAAAAAPKQTFLSKMKSLIHGETTTPKPQADVFVQKPTVAKPDTLDLAKGQVKNDSLVTTQINEFKQPQAKLKENTFKMAPKDVPFKITTTKDQDALVNANAIPIQVGPKTTLPSRSFEKTQMPAMQSKTFIGHAGSSGQALAMGSATAAQTPALNSAASSSNARATATPATGREWTSHSSAFNGNGNSSLARNTVSDFDSPVASGKSSNAKDSNFNITGALRGRPITQKIFPPYERDARVALRFRVDYSGHVLDGILVEISSGSPSFDQKVVAALKEWTFSRLSSDRANEIQEGVITFVFKGV